MTRQLISIILGLCFYSCTNKNVDNTPAQEIDMLHSANDTDTIVRHFNIDPYKIFAEYAKGYKPVGTNANPNIDLPELNDTLKFAIDSLLQTDTSTLRILTTIILTKQFLHHLNCCNQSYEIRNGFDRSGNLNKELNPVLYAFLQVSNQIDVGNRNNEFLSSGFIHSYLQEHNELASHALIKPYFDKLEKIEQEARGHIKED